MQSTAALKKFEIYDKISSNPYTLYEILENYLGECIGQGSSRWVFEFNNKLVLKIEKGNWHANAIEWDTWMAVYGTKWEKWFAPIEYISPNGRLMFQRKCNKVYEQPKKLPNFLADVKLSNLGELNGQIVAIDYSINRLIENGLKIAKLAHTKDRLNS
jgi:hypothetical protein